MARNDTKASNLHTKKQITFNQDQNHSKALWETGGDATAAAANSPAWHWPIGAAVLSSASLLGIRLCWLVTLLDHPKQSGHKHWENGTDGGCWMWRCNQPRPLAPVLAPVLAPLTLTCGHRSSISCDQGGNVRVWEIMHAKISFH